MPHLVKFLLRHAAIGCTVAVLFVGALVAFDIARLGTLAASTPDGMLAIVVLTLAVGITFGSAQMGFAIMLMSERGASGNGRRMPRSGLALQPVAVVARRRR